MRQLYSFYSDAFWIALKSILEHKLRALLTLVGIIIGVAAVVVVGASIAGLKTYVIDQVSKVLGSNHYMMTRMASMEELSDEEFERRNRRNKDITWEEYEYLRDNLKLSSYVGAQMNAGTDLQEGTIEMPSVRMMGVTDNMAEIEDKTLEEGRFFSKEEVTRNSAVAVIGMDVKEKFFEFTSPIGKTLKIRGVPVTIIGLERKRGSFFGQSQDRHVYIPITLHNQIFNRTNGVQVHGKTIEKANFHPAIEEAELMLRNRRQLIGSEESTFSVV